MSENNLLPKKVGEVTAFAIVALEFFERANKASYAAFGKDNVNQMINTLKQQADTARVLADGAKTQKTTKKLRSMMEKYIGEEWDNPTELLEWSGFMWGAAAVHWALVAELLRQKLDNDLNKFALRQESQYIKWLKLSCLKIQSIK